MKRLVCLIVAAAMLLTLCGCGREEGQDKQPKKLDNTHLKSETDAGKQKSGGKETGGKTYFDHSVWRGDVKYSNMEYERYEAEWFDEYTEPIYTLAREGGSGEEFADADFELENELYYVYTMYELAELASSADPSDDELADEMLSAQDMYYRMYEEYRKAMRELARSRNKDLIRERYGGDYIPYFANYTELSDEEYESMGEENALVSRYYALVSADEPDYDAIGDIFVSLVKLRQAEAAGYGYDSYADYAYESFYYKDYTPDETRAVWDGAKRYFAPIAAEYTEKVSDGTLMLLSDEGFDTGAGAILDALERTLPDFSWELYEAYRYMTDCGLCDIEHDPYKSNTGYTITLYYFNEPFVFNAAYDEFYDYTDTFHEFGHFVNGYYTMPDLLYGYSDNDLCELQAQGMEMMMTHYYGEIFGEHAKAALGYVLMNMVYSVLDGAMYDEFQYRVYSEKDLTAARVNEIYADVYESYGYEPYDGYEYEWMSVGHNFEQPFYYISYAVSALAALELYDLAQDDWEAAKDKFLTAAAMDPEEYYYSEALTEAGFADIFSGAAYKGIAEAIETALAG